MKLETFFEKFEFLADAPGAVAKMRELVLQLAVRGRLVSQSPNDKPVDALAATIAEDRAAFVKERSLARQRVFAPVEDDQCPFALPSGWAWTRLGTLCRAQAGFAFESAAFVQGDAGVPMIRIRDITKDHTQVKYIGEYREEFLVETGDYLVGMDGNFAVAKWRGPRALLNQRVSRLQWYSQHLEPSFFAIAAQYRLSELQGTKAYTTVDHLSSGQIENVVVPLPPLAEQKRIVAKVDELMALCNQLEAQQQERETRHDALARASLARFADAPTPANLDVLFHKSYSIPPADLRKSILSLAVQGKLIPQDPIDEPASELLVRIATEQDRLVKERAIRRQETAPINESDQPFAVPATWAWTRLGQVADWGSGSTPARSNHELYGGGITWLKSGELNDNRQLSGSDETVSELALATGSFRRNRAGDVLLAMYGATIGKAAILAEPAVTNQAVCGCTPFSGLLSTYLFLYLVSQREQFHLASEGGAQPNISKVKIVGYPFPLPPLAEQHRIAAKVDELMVLVDELEAQLATARNTGSQLVEAVVAELTQGRALA